MSNCKNCGGGEKGRGKGKIKKRYLCYSCDRIFSSTRLSEKEATCPYCKAVPCISCGKLPTPMRD